MQASPSTVADSVAVAGRIVSRAASRNWVFLGDSLTEGVGSSRATYVTEFVKLLRAADRQCAVHDLRLRVVEPETFNPYIKTNLAGFLDEDPNGTEPALWIWNLAAEGRTIESDVSWMPWLRNIRPERVVIYRGSLESIVRPAHLQDGSWPWWVPRSWRGFVALDPRCYFSTTWYRRAKEASVDALKQVVRHRLLAAKTGRPLIEADVLLKHLQELLAALDTLETKVSVLGLIPPDEQRFPGTPAHFAAVNERLRSLANAAGAEFIDWTTMVTGRTAGPWRYRDGFHPNLAGSQLLARVLHDRLGRESS